jgi:hypothetical protein
MAILKRGLALWCDARGTINKIISNETALPDSALTGRRFIDIIGTAGLPAARDFMAALNKDGSAFDLPVAIFAGSASAALRCDAARSGRGLFIAGYAPGGEPALFIEFLLNIYTDNRKAVRDAIIILLSVRLENAARNSHLFDDFTSLNNELVNMQREVAKKNAELEKALAEIKTLRGILPICTICKKIRDDKGYWHQVEVYIRKHSNAEFSHSLCQECVKKLYPEFHKDRE